MQDKKIIDNLISSSDFLDIFSNVDEGVIITDVEGRIIFYNRAQAELDLIDSRYVLNRLVSEVYDITKNESLILKCLKNGQAIVNQRFLYRLGPEKICAGIHTVLPINSEGRLKGAICFIRNGKIIKNGSSMTSLESQPFKNGTKFTFSDLIGVNTDFLRSIKRAKEAAISKSSIMICGETGTGKEMLAQAIHNQSLRREKSFVAVNCAAIPESLLESTLFGTRKGAFTGAVEQEGLFEEAQESTLYLDEVDSMQPSVQVKLLRVLQDMNIRRVGSNQEKHVDVRVISSINKEYGQPLTKDTIRKDLYYRLSVVFIELPPLRARKEDIDILAGYFVQKYNILIGKKVRSISPDVLELFKNYDWPGNVRELEHVIEGSLHIVDDEEELHMDHLPANFFVSDSLSASGTSSKKRSYTLFPINNKDHLLNGLDRLKSSDTELDFQEELNLIAAQNRREVEMIYRAIRECRGKISQAARKLGVSRQLLHYKLKKYNISPQEFKQ